MPYMFIWRFLFFKSVFLIFKIKINKILDKNKFNYAHNFNILLSDIFFIEKYDGFKHI